MMNRFFLFIIISLLVSSCTQVKYFVVRHAEKETPSDGPVMFTPNDPPLSSAGEARAVELREVLKTEDIRHIYSTNTIRTISTAKPLSDLLGDTPVELYNSRDSLDYFIARFKEIRDGNVLIVGHSNTVDDIVNKLCGEVKVPGDLPDSEYDNLYLVIKKGNRMKFGNRTYGVPTN